LTLALHEQTPDDPLAEFGITDPESALLNAVHYGVRTEPADLPGHVAGADYTLADPTTVEECQAALAACLARGWLRVLDEAAVQEIADDIRAGGILGPIYRLPEVGVVDFTPAGADLWRRLGDRLRGGSRRTPFEFMDVVHTRTARYFPTRAAAVAATEGIRGWDGVVSVTEPSPIGPWRVQWWRRFPAGYRIEVESRHRWQGRCGAGQGWVLTRPARWRADPGRLRHILDCHNVSVGEWLLFTGMDHYAYRSPHHLPGWVSDSAEQLFGVTAGEEECRRGLDACLRNGWLRVVDQAVLDEVHALLQQDPAKSPFSREEESRPGEVDFTPCGAALYRMISAEYAGPDWEDGLDVWRERYREEHLYCESEEGFRDTIQRYAAEGETIRASRLVPIGPWCVYWWERFPAGYRLELEIGEP
jgi:hypothetical protein